MGRGSAGWHSTSTEPPAPASPFDDRPLWLNVTMNEQLWSLSVLWEDCICWHKYSERQCVHWKCVCECILFWNAWVFFSFFFLCQYLSAEFCKKKLLFLCGLIGVFCSMFLRREKKGNWDWVYSDMFSRNEFEGHLCILLWSVSLFLLFCTWIMKVLR